MQDIGRKLPAAAIQQPPLEIEGEKRIASKAEWNLKKTLLTKKHPQPIPKRTNQGLDYEVLSNRQHNQLHDDAEKRTFQPCRSV
jgi:hypothetical protein